MKVDQDFIMKEIDGAEVKFNNCFEILKALKMESIEGIDFLSFQPTLAEALYDLMSVYKIICADEKSLISNKDNIPENEFKEAIKNVHNFKKILLQTVNIGKMLGDSFVWLFYNDNQQELYKHLNHSTTGVFVAGIGGRGEIEFIKQNPELYGCLVLYHGITSSLRVGDFSLYTYHNGIVATGELKTKIIDGKLDITAYISSRYKLNADNLIPDKTVIDYNTHQKERLERQLSAMDDLLKKQKVDHKANFLRENNVDFEFPSVPNKMSFKLSRDNTLLTCILQIEGMRLSERLFSTLDGDIGIDQVTSYAQSLLVEGSDNNQFYMTAIDGECYPTRIPLFWWNADIDFLKEIIFRKITMMTIFNPAKFLDYYVEKGFKVCNSTGPKNVGLEKEIGGKKMSIENLYMFFDMITYSFMPIENIFSIIDKTIEKSLENGKQGSGRIDITPFQRLY